MRNDRGFSMLLVLLTVIVMAVLGVTTLTISNTEAGAAEARAVQRQALAAADAGINHFLGSAPAAVTVNTYFIGKAGSDTVAANFVALQETKNPAGQSVQSRYRVYTLGAGPVPNSAIVRSEGQVVVGGQIVGRSLVSAIVSATPGSGSNVAGQGQKSLGAWGTSSNLPARTDISLTNL